ncbi:endonuclease [Sulfitobacter sp. TSTF-M16]|uniref:Endonuclease n=1 Tax=Sulfitobacter aestuariivivens TaxID=2766981 RepID=A0A927D3D7_9RHOB|nr:endonuclease [Sulfitobacter aestuariivivens]MBD3663568.1 endonuclease [Sulfitobacter aestuariivivens]
MTDQPQNSSCTITCWGIAVLAGIAVMAMLMVIGDWDIVPSIFVAGIVALVLGAVLARFICSAGTARQDLEAVRAGTQGAQAAKAAATADRPNGTPEAPPSAQKVDTTPVGLVDAGAANAAVKPSKALAGQDDLATRKGEWKYENPGQAGPGKVIEEKSRAGDPSNSDADEREPEILVTPRDGGPDDLKLISGVGPKLEGTLNELGFWHFDQIANWGDEEINWVDARLTFKGRIRRDDWVDQAKTLAAGGETDFSKKKKK